MRQADKRRLSLRASLLHLVALGCVAAVCASAQAPNTPPGQTPAAPPGQTPTTAPGQTPPGPGGQMANPTTGTQNPNQTSPPALARQHALPDYRTTQDPRLPIGPASDQKLPLFGYSFFAPARQAIEFRRVYLTRMLFGQATAALSGGTAPNIGGQNGAAGLTDAQ